MARLWQQIRKGEKGQALPIVLVLLVVGGLIITPCLNYAATSLKAGQIVKENVRGIYAADAGIEDALWKLKNDSPPTPPYDLPEPVNQMQVTIETLEDLGKYALYDGDLIEVTQPHYDWLAVDGEIGEWDEEAEAYPYTITVTRQPEAEGNIFLEEVGVRLPVGYEYKPDSSASFFEGELFSTDEPVDDPIEQDYAGAYMPRWRFEMGGQDKPEVTEEYPAIQTFYVTGTGGQEGDYAWVEALSGDIDIVGEVIGALYRITARATRPGDVEPTATVVADAMFNEGTEEIQIIVWQINPQ